MLVNDLISILGQSNRIRLIYRDAQNEVTERVVDVERFYRCTSKGRALVVGYCHRRREYRTFAVDAILWAMPEADATVETFGPDPMATPDALAWLPILAMPGLICEAVA